MRLDQDDILGDAVFVRLSQRKNHRPQYTLIDRDDFERVARSNWSWRDGYAVATSNRFLAKHHMRLAAYVLKAGPGQIIDHISGDRLDNRSQNLRIVTAAQNAKNAKRPTFPGKTSRFKGVCWHRHRGKWLAGITSDGLYERLGFFDDEGAAALAYDAAALKLHGEFARTNAQMKLFEMEDPFVPDCSGGVAFGPRRHRHRNPMHPVHNFNAGRQRKNYQRNMDAALQRLIERHTSS